VPVGKEARAVSVRMERLRSEVAVKTRVLLKGRIRREERRSNAQRRDSAYRRVGFATEMTTVGMEVMRKDVSDPLALPYR
jgi:hypothetical protein